MPNREPIPAHAHVTEVARIDKRYVDCGGTFRSEAFCRLQTWVADDTEHRLSAGKLLAILGKAGAFLGGDEIEVDVEYECGVITHSPIATVSANDGRLTIQLAERHTACLAPEKCIPASALGAFRAIPTLTHSSI